METVHSSNKVNISILIYLLIDFRCWMHESSFSHWFLSIPISISVLFSASKYILKKYDYLATLNYLKTINKNHLFVVLKVARKIYATYILYPQRPEKIAYFQLQNTN